MEVGCDTLADAALSNYRDLFPVHPDALAALDAVRKLSPKQFDALTRLYLAERGIDHKEWIEF